MAQDNYIAFGDRQPIPLRTLPSILSPSNPIKGTGSPEGSVPGVTGQPYTDITTGDLYVKMVGNGNVGWVKVATSPGDSGSGGGSQTTFSVAADPNGVLNVSGPAIAVGTGTVAGTVWVKSTAGESSTDWVAVIV